MFSQSIAAISSPLSPSLFTSKSFCSQTQLGFLLNPEVIRTNGNRNISISCSSSVHVGNSVGLKGEPGLDMKDLISLGSATYFNKCEKAGKQLTQQELLACVRATRRHQKYNLALEVYEWMKNQGDRFKMSSEDIAIQLDLIFKVHGISSVEEYFLKLPESSKDNLSYEVLLSAYVQAEMREKAESLFEKMRGKGYTSCSLPFNSMMTLYLRLKNYEKVMALIAEMLEKNIQLDLSSYNIWVFTSGALGSTEKMDQVVEKMKLDSHIDPDWKVYSTMAFTYIKLHEKEKAKVCLKEVEKRITDGDWMPYESLLTLYSGIGQKEDVYRIWSTCKSRFPNSLSLVKAMSASMFFLNDAEFAEKILVESNDPRLLNLLVCQYANGGLLEQAKVFADREEGKVYSKTWECLAVGYTKKSQRSNAMLCVKKAATTALGAKSWRPDSKTLTVLNFYCGLDVKSEDMLLNVLRK